MEANKDIRIYGTLVNHTVNNAISDNNHNDALAYAYQIYDDRFGATPNSANFQDAINKRVSAISYANGVTTIDGNLAISGDIIMDGGSSINPSDIQDIIERLNQLEQTVTQLSNTVTALSNEVIQIGSRATQVEQLVNQLNTTVNQQNQAISNMQSTVASIQGLWTLSADGTHVVSSRPADAAGFYDTTI